MDNYDIAEQFSLLAKLMDIHGENSFKSKSYSSAAFTLEKLPQAITAMPREKIFAVKGIGESVGNKIIEILDTGALTSLKEYVSKTPEGVLEMMNIKGLGPKKINLLWKEMSIDTIDALAIACQENRIAQTKGFGEKTQQNILDSIKFQQDNAGKYLYAKLEAFVEALTIKLKEKFPKQQLEISGDFRRQLEIIESLEWVTTITTQQIQDFLLSDDMTLVSDRDGLLILSADDRLILQFHCVGKDAFANKLFSTSASDPFLQPFDLKSQVQTEEAIFKSAKQHFIPAFAREQASIFDRKIDWENIVQVKDIKGLIHSHSNWSDGAYTLDEMADALIRQGFEYLVISDHSKSAFYANGLSEARIREQHQYIDELNARLKPFRIFKSIECDILNDGSLDYEDKVLSSFDLVITSVHSNLDMDSDKATRRVLGAVTNPYTTILGHMTGRLLLRRKGYPVDHRTIIDACAEHGVVIEINANPNRLDMDWRWIDYALEKGVMLSINPDAHTIEEFHNIKYGVLTAQKGALTAKRNLSSLSLGEFEKYITQRKKRIS